MSLVDSIAYFSGYLASLIDFPTNWRHITMWFSMDADIVSSVSIIFDYHVSLNLANILHNFCVSQWGSSLVFPTFKVSRIIDWFPYKLESHYHVVLHGCSNCFVSVHYFDYHVSLNLANILHNFCVSQWGSSIVFPTFKVSRIIDWFPYKLESHYHVVLHGCSNCFVSVHYFDYHVSLNLADIPHNFCVSQWGSSILLHTFQGITCNWFFFPQIGVSLPCGYPWMHYLFHQCPLFSVINCP